MCAVYIYVHVRVGSRRKAYIIMIYDTWTKKNLDEKPVIVNEAWFARVSSSSQVSTSESAAEGEEVKNVVEFRGGLEYSQPSQPQKEKKRTGSSSASPDKKVKRTRMRTRTRPRLSASSPRNAFIWMIRRSHLYISEWIYRNDYIYSYIYLETKRRAEEPARGIYRETRETRVITPHRLSPHLHHDCPHDTACSRERENCSYRTAWK